jgi:HNH endonuclease
MSRPGAIHDQIIEVMKRFPEGVTVGQVREALGIPPGEQTFLDRRVRDTPKWFKIQKIPARRTINGKTQSVVLYRYLGPLDGISDEGQVSQRVRASVIHAAHGRCQMCGSTIQQEGIKLVVDHKIPREWGGSNDPDNLWAICTTCNGGKKSYFSSVNADAEIMKKALSYESVHMRTGELLKAYGIGAEVPTAILEIVAGQDEWRKRLRELRYPVIGWEIDNKTRKINGRKKSFYVLRAFLPWPGDPTSLIREYEEERRRRNRRSQEVEVD